MMHPTVDYFQFHVSDVADLRDTVRALKGQDDVLV
jgi:hypothetical protein